MLATQRRTTHLCFAMIALTGIGVKIAVNARAQTPVVIVRPFIMERWTISNGLDQGEKVERKELQEQRSDGAIGTRVLEMLDNGAGESLTRHLRLPDGRDVTLNDNAQIRMTLRLSDTELARFKESILRASLLGSQDCGRAAEFRAADSNVAGYATQAWWHEDFLETTRMRTTIHRAPELGCAELRRLRERRNADGTYTKQSENVVRYVVHADPPASDFDPGNSYREVGPSEFDKLTSRGIAEMERRIAEGWCKTHDCSSAELYHQQLAKREDEYKRRH